jgi:hypothetical protein
VISVLHYKKVGFEKKLISKFSPLFDFWLLGVKAKAKSQTKHTLILF